MLALSVAKSSDVWMGDLYSDWKWKQFECCEAWKPVDICGDGLIWTPLPSFLHWTVIFFSCLGFWQRTDSFQYAFEESDSFPQSSSLQRVKFPLPYSPLYISNCHSLQKLANFWAHLCPPSDAKLLLCNYAKVFITEDVGMANRIRCSNWKNDFQILYPGFESFSFLYIPLYVTCLPQKP